MLVYCNIRCQRNALQYLSRIEHKLSDIFFPISSRYNTFMLFRMNKGKCFRNAGNTVTRSINKFDEPPNACIPTTAVIFDSVTWLIKTRLIHCPKILI